MKKYNLIYVFADQLRRDCLGCCGDVLARTPNIDAFAGRSANMLNACSTHPLGGPYRASLFTGKYSTSTGMVMDGLRMKPEKNTFANILADSGYTVDFIGKWRLYANQKGDCGNPKNSFVPEGENRLGFNGYFAAYDNHYGYFAPDAYYHLNSPSKSFSKGFEPDHQTFLASEIIKKHSEKGEPFALFLSYATPHGRWIRENVPAEYYNMFTDTSFSKPGNFCKKGDPHGDYLSRLSPKDIPQLDEAKHCYYAMTANLDENFGRLISCVKSLGLADNTIIVFTSDHGEMFGSHGRKGKNIFYDEAVRVPLFISSPGIKSVSNKTPVGTVDIMPTLLKLMGINPPPGTQGQDLSESVASGKFRENPCLLIGAGPCDIWGRGREWRGIRTENYTYAVYASDLSEFLFDNLRDSLQMNNLSGSADYVDIKIRLKASMYQKMAQAGDLFRKNGYFKRERVKNRIILN